MNSEHVKRLIGIVNQIIDYIPKRFEMISKEFQKRDEAISEAIQKRDRRIEVLEALISEIALHHLDTMIVSDNKHIREFAKRHLKDDKEDNPTRSA